MNKSCSSPIPSSIQMGHVRPRGLHHLSFRARGLHHLSFRARGLHHLSFRARGLHHLSFRARGLHHLSVKRNFFSLSLTTKLERMKIKTPRPNKPKYVSVDPSISASTEQLLLLPDQLSQQNMTYRSIPLHKPCVT